MDTIKVTIDRENGRITVWNNGKGIPVVIHKQYNMYVPSLIFGQLLTGGNFNDDEKKVTGGRNGYGAKLTNIYSTEFRVETADKKEGKKFRQTWHDNMSKEDKPVITNFRGSEYTEVSYVPDLSLFHMEGLDDDIVALMEKRGNVVSREKLMERLWETDSFVDENTLSVNVNRLRKRLAAAGLEDFIATKFGVGYLIGD